MEPGRCLENFSGGYALYAFDLTSDLGEDDHFSLAKQGSVRLVLNFGEALVNPVTVIAYAEFQNVIEIDRNRNVISSPENYTVLSAFLFTFEILIPPCLSYSVLSV